VLRNQVQYFTDGLKAFMMGTAITSSHPRYRLQHPWGPRLRTMPRKPRTVPWGLRSLHPRSTCVLCVRVGTTLIIRVSAASCDGLDSRTSRSVDEGQYLGHRAPALALTKHDQALCAKDDEILDANAAASVTCVPAPYAGLELALKGTDNVVGLVTAEGRLDCLPLRVIDPGQSLTRRKWLRCFGSPITVLFAVDVPACIQPSQAASSPCSPISPDAASPGMQNPDHAGHARLRMVLDDVIDEWAALISEPTLKETAWVRDQPSPGS
jgi:hypothetical protein